MVLIKSMNYSGLLKLVKIMARLLEMVLTNI